MEAIVVDPDLLQELEENIDAALGILGGIRAVIPRHERGAGAEGISEGIAHAMPVGRGEAEMIPHRFALDEFTGVIALEGQAVRANPRPGRRWEEMEENADMDYFVFTTGDLRTLRLELTPL